MSRTDEEKAVRLWVREIVRRYDTAHHQVQVIYADQQNSSRPALPYASVLRISGNYIGSEGTREYINNDDPAYDASEVVRRTIEATFTVQVYGQNNSQMAQDLRMSLNAQGVVDFNMGNGLVVVQTTQNPTRLSTNTNGVTEDRTVTGYLVRYNREFISNVDYTIESAEITLN